MISAKRRPVTPLDWIDIDIVRDLAEYLELPVDQDEILDAVRDRG
jgi:hypothetical protein